MLSLSLSRYDPAADSWTQLGNMERGRSAFALVPVNGTLTAIAGWNVSVRHLSMIIYDQQSLRKT